MSKITNLILTSKQLKVFQLISLLFLVNLASCATSGNRYLQLPNQVHKFEKWTDLQVEDQTPIGSEVTVHFDGGSEKLYKRTSTYSANSYKFTKKFSSKSEFDDVYFEVPEQILRPMFDSYPYILYTYNGLAYDKDNTAGREITKDEMYKYPIRIVPEGIVFGKKIFPFSDYEPSKYNVRKTIIIDNGMEITDYFSFKVDFSYQEFDQNEPFRTGSISLSFDPENPSAQSLALPDSFQLINFKRGLDFLEIHKRNVESYKKTGKFLNKSEQRALGSSATFKIHKPFPCGTIFQISHDPCD